MFTDTHTHTVILFVALDWSLSALTEAVWIFTTGHPHSLSKVFIFNQINSPLHRKHSPDNIDTNRDNSIIDAYRI